MEMPQNDFGSILFFEDACKKAEAAYAINPIDADNLTRWGGALLELSQIQSGHDCIRMIDDAVSKLEVALKVNPRKDDTLWCLGNAHTFRGFYMQDHEQAKIYFGKAAECFQQAVEEDPGNDLYLKSLALSSQAPELHLELQKRASSQQTSLREYSTSNVKAAGTFSMYEYNKKTTWDSKEERHTHEMESLKREAENHSGEIQMVFQHLKLLTEVESLSKKIDQSTKKIDVLLGKEKKR